MFKCRYTIIVWNLVFEWLGIHSPTLSWSSFQPIKEWWCSNDGMVQNYRKAKTSLQMLICWEIWNERNARVFRSKPCHPSRVVVTIKDEAKTWVIAWARLLGNLIMGE
ncbi:hypothetical protein VPH35_004423 [Triticum aestivum]